MHITGDKYFLAEPAVYLTLWRRSPLASPRSSRHKTLLSLPSWAGAAQSLPTAPRWLGPPPALAVSIISLFSPELPYKSAQPRPQEVPELSPWAGAKPALGHWVGRGWGGGWREGRMRTRGWGPRMRTGGCRPGDADHGMQTPSVPSHRSLPFTAHRAGESSPWGACCTPWDLAVPRGSSSFIWEPGSGPVHPTRRNM